MAIRQVGQLSLADGLLPQRGGERLAAIDGLIDWGKIAALLSGLHGSPLGAPAYPPLVMMKALILAQWYVLSDPQLEEALVDRLSFRRFVGLSVVDATPDHSSISRFRSTLSQMGLAERVFDEVTRQIDAREFIVRQGTMIDATLVEAQVKRPKPPKDETSAPGKIGRKRGPGGRARHRKGQPRPASKLVKSRLDPDAAWAKKGGKRTFGYKAHVAADRGSGVIRRAILTPASVADTTMGDALIMGDEKEVYGDAAYDTKARRRGLKERRVKDRIAHRPNRHHPLTPRQAQRNAGIARRRAGIERVFATAKCRMGWRRVRYRGLVRNAGHLHVMCTAMNLDRLRVLSMQRPEKKKQRQADIMVAG